MTNAPAAAARPAITLLNEAGISTVSVGDDALKAEACSAGVRHLPGGPPDRDRRHGVQAPPSSFTSTFTSHLGFTPTETAWRAYQGTKSILSSLAAPGVATDAKTPRLNRDALAAALVAAHSNCTS